MQYGGYRANVLTLANDTPSRTNPIRGWAISYVRDQLGNTMLFFYTQQSIANQGRTSPIDDGVFYPTAIHYSGHLSTSDIGHRTVRLRSGERNSATPVKYQAGFALAHSDKRLNTIDLYADSGTENDRHTGFYRSSGDGSLNGPRHITTITKCDSLTTTRCLASLDLVGEVSATTPFDFSNGSVGFPGTRTDYDHFFVDINGDGKKHWLQISQSVDEAWVGSAPLVGAIKAAHWAKYTQPVGATNSFSHHFADIDGDGKADWIRVSRTANEAWRALGLGNGNFQPWTKVPASVAQAGVSTHYFADVNGDGRADWIQFDRSAPGSYGTSSVALSAGNGNFHSWTGNETFYGSSGNYHFADVNGDGMDDRLRATTDPYYELYASNGDGTFVRLVRNDYLTPLPVSAVKFEAGTKHLFADLNADGNADIIRIQPTGGAYVSYGKGNGKITDPVILSSSYKGNDITGDIDGDGMDDLLSMAPGSPTGSTARLALSYHHPAWVTFNLTPQDGVTGSNQVYLEDVNGDGKADLILISTVTKQAWVGFSQAATTGKVISISNPGMPSTDVTYKPLADPTVYSPDNDAVYPMRDSLLPMQRAPRMQLLVASVASPNGIGGKLTTNYSYGGGKVDLTGRGFMGMRWNESTQIDTGITTRNDFRLDWPYTGRPSSTKRLIASRGNNGLLAQTIYQYACTDFVGGGCASALGRRYFVYMSSLASESWDLSGAPFPEITASFEYDEFGNVIRSIDTTSDGFQTQTDSVFSNDATKWRIGSPTRVTVAKTVP